MMSNPHFPPEILDYIVDNLHDEHKTLQNCCLVAKSWIPRARKYLFAEIKFTSPEALESWKKAFLDPFNSPAHHTRTLWIKCFQAFTETDAEEGGLIQSFSRIERLTVDCCVHKIPVAPFHKFSSLKSLHVSPLSFSHSQLFHLIHSLPSLEDLTLVGHDMFVIDEPSTVVTSTSPALTGTLGLVLYRGMVNITRLLLNLPNGLHFRRLNLCWSGEEDLRWMVELVVACSNTLKCLDVTCALYDDATPDPIDLSKATKLKHVVFRCRSLSTRWIPMTLETITSRHRDLQQISIDVTAILSHAAHENPVELIEETNPGARWSDLDRLLLKFWDSHSIRPKVVDSRTEDEKRGTRDWVRYLFPEATKGGIIDVVELCES